MPSSRLASPKGTLDMLILHSLTPGGHRQLAIKKNARRASLSAAVKLIFEEGSR